MTDSFDIKAKAPFPAGALSNFALHSFTIDGVHCASMEGFLQSLKIQDVRVDVHGHSVGDGKHCCESATRRA